MKLRPLEVVGIATSIGLIALALFFMNVKENHQKLVGLQNSVDKNEAVVVSSVGNQRAALVTALTEAGASNQSVKKLVIDDIYLGTGPKVVNGDTVTVHYLGVLTNGTQFDNSRVRGEPFQFTVGDGRVIGGWEQGIIGMQVGGQRTLVIPPELGYGKAGSNIVPRGATMIFTIELLAIE